MEKQGRSELLARARESAVSPGCYLMKDLEGGVLYVGKAKSLRARLASYFQGEVHPHPRTELMVQRVERFDLILTETENEALILENTLIKKYKPRFNVRLKDDKAYPYLKLQVHQPFPRLEWTRKVKRDGARYFGPFPSAWAARQVLDLINEVFQLRDCSDNTFSHRSRACILHQMGKCSAPCVGVISEEDYRTQLREVVAILDGKSNKLSRELRKAMEGAAAEEKFEKAAYYRDQIRNLELVTQTQSVSDAGAARNRDVLGLARLDTDAHVSILRIRGGHLISVQHFVLNNTDSTLSDAELMDDILGQVYATEIAAYGADPAAAAVESVPEAAAEERGPAPPKEVLLPETPTDPDIVELFANIGISVLVAAKRDPARTKDEQLLQVARANAQYALEQDKKRAQGHGLKALEEVQDKLQMAKLPHRIECYDNSNIQGEDAVASRVVFIDGAPDKNLYRRYKIRTVEGANDFATMREVLGRRFSKSDEELPDLVVVDGGKGQLAQAVAILEELAVQGVAVCGLAKARTESDFQAAEVNSSMERIFIPGRKNPVALLPHTGAYKLLVHVRDEAHRFAIAYHRLLRGKRSLRTGKD